MSSSTSEFCSAVQTQHIRNLLVLSRCDFVVFDFRAALAERLLCMFFSFFGSADSQIYELLRQYTAVRTITQHPEFNQVTTMIMMVLDYLNAALEVNTESKSVEKQIVGEKKRGVTRSIIITMRCWKS